MRHTLVARWPLCLIVVALLAVGCQSTAVPSPTPPPSGGVIDAPAAIEAGSITALGTVRPVQSLQLGFLTGGPVRSVLVRVGVSVEAGDLLAELDTAELALAVREAEDGLMLSEAQLDQARAGAREQELDIARAKLDLAVARHEQLPSGATAEEVAIADAAYQASVAKYERIETGASQSELAAAEAKLVEARVALARAQATYDLIAGEPGIEATAEAAALRAATAEHLVAVALYDQLAALPSEIALREAEARVTRTQADYDAAVARHEQVLAGVSPQELAVARANVDKAEISRQHAQAAYDRVASSPGVAASPQAVALQAATIEYEAAVAQYEWLASLPRQAEVAEAEARVTGTGADHEAALANYARVRAGAPDSDLIQAQANLEQAEAALLIAQAAYDTIAAVDGIELTSEAAALRAAQAEYAAAEARYDALSVLPDDADLLEAEAAVVRSQAQLDLLRKGPSAEEIRASAGEVAVARSQLELVGAGPRPEDVAVAAARVRQARTRLEWAELASSRHRLVAPIGGTVSAVHRSPGEWATPGAAVLELVDTSTWLVETRNVSELDIARVRVGQGAIVRIISLPGAEVRGKLVAISPVAAVQQGDTTYTVTIELESTDLILRAGMNAKVEILTD